jgi:hypothetical protein
MASATDAAQLSLCASSGPTSSRRSDHPPASPSGAGRLLSAPNESKGDRGGTDWLYRDGFAAGVRWACESATFDDLERLAADNALLWLVASPWLRGFMDAVAELWQDMSGAPVSTAS